MFCVECGGSVPEGVRFCNACGSPVGGAAGATAVPVAAPITKQLTEKVRARSLDAWQGLKLFVKNPVGGLPESFAMLGDQRATQVGVLFAVAFEVATLFGLSRLASQAMGVMGFGLPLGELFGARSSASDLTAAQFVKAIVLGLVPFASLTGATALARLVFGGKGRFAGDVYTAGASLLPLGFFVLAASLLGVANIEVIAVLGLFALTYTILMLYAGCSQIAGMSAVGAAPAVPVVLLVSAWLTKVIVVAMS